MRLLPLAVVVAAVATATAAEAATTLKLEFGAGQQPLRTPTNDRLFDGKVQGAVINRKDCETGGGLQFTLANGFQTKLEYLQIWARTDSNVGTTCAPRAARIGIAGEATSPACRLVIQFSRGELEKTKGVFLIPDRNIIGAAYNSVQTYKTTPIASEYEAVEVSPDVACKPRGPMSVSYGPSVTPNLQLSFLPIDGSGAVTPGDEGGEMTWSGVYDIAGPTAPTDLLLQGGNQQLYATFTGASTDTSLFGYTVFCVKTNRKWGSSVPTTDTGVAETTDAGADSGAATDSADDADSADADEASADAADGAGDTSDTGDTSDGATESGSSTSGNTSATCGDPSGLLVEGAYPSAALDPYVCGTANQALSSTKVQMTGLDNDYYYAVAVAGRDVHGNTGPLSVIGCEAPGATLDFWERYREAGGQGGGGYCAYGHGPAGAASVVGLVAALSFVGRRAQTRKR